uniref:Uncharacterized protein n=1 Tax=Rhizophora mucronata TaxID=61149 RepID=A0A2P2N6X4_RHIMU
MIALCIKSILMPFTNFS